MTIDVASVDVFLLDKENMAALPNRIKVANRIINFKSGFKKFIDSSQNVNWIDNSHFKFELKPYTTVDFTDIAGGFVNLYPEEDVRVVVTANGKLDTLLNGRSDFRLDKFVIKRVGFSTSLLYHDIK